MAEAPQEERRSRDSIARRALERKVIILDSALQGVEEQLRAGREQFTRNGVKLSALEGALRLNTEICTYNREVCERTEKQVQAHIGKMDEVLAVFTTVKTLDKASVGGAKRIGIYGGAIGILVLVWTKAQEYYHLFLK